MEAFIRGKNGSVNMIVVCFSNSGSAYTKINQTSLWPAESSSERDRGPPGLLLF